MRILHFETASQPSCILVVETCTAPNGYSFTITPKQELVEVEAPVERRHEVVQRITLLPLEKSELFPERPPRMPLRITRALPPDVYMAGLRISLVAIFLVAMLTLLRGIPPWVAMILVFLIVLDFLVDLRKLKRAASEASAT